MKSSPIKTLRSSPFMQPEGGMSGGSDISKKKTYTKLAKTTTKKTSAGAAIADFITPESAGEAILGVLPVGGAGVSKWLTKSKAGKKVLSKVPGLGKLFKPRDIVKNKPVDFSKSRDFSGKVKGGVDAGDIKNVDLYNANISRYGQGDPNLLPTPRTVEEASKITANATKDIGMLGKRMDNAGYNIKNLDPKKSVKKLGQGKGGQTIYEVTYPGGEKLQFWQSSGSGKKGIEFRQSHNQHLNDPTKGASKDYFGVLPGYMDRSKLPRGTKGRTDTWFVKSDGWEQGYGSNVIEDTGIWLKSLKDNNII